MRRLLVHPTLKVLLPLVLVLWLGSVANVYYHTDRGFLADITADLIPSQGRATNPSGVEYLRFYLLSDDSIGVASKSHTAEILSVLNGKVIALSKHDPGSTRYHGLVYTPIRSRKFHSSITWTPPSLENNPLTVSDLEAAMEPYREMWRGPAVTSDEIFELEHSGLLRSSIIGLQLPLVQPSTTKWKIDPGHLAGELAYYATFIWWIITLIYARKLWPKPDDTRCPNCRYETAGLTTQTCPECGKDLPSPREP
jgi:hypothetical protein